MPTPSANWKMLLPFYLEGRETAAEEFDAEDVDYEALAGSVGELVGAQGIAARARDAATLHNSDAADSKADWIRDHRGEIRSARVSEQEAFDAWLMGYTDEIAMALEGELVNALAEEDTAVETPSGKRSATATPNPGEASYASWYQTGIQDCQNSFDASDLDDEIEEAVAAFQKHRQDISKLAQQAVKDYWSHVSAESKEAWLGQHEDDVRADRLKPDRAYEFWADGWRSQAQRYVAEKIVERAE